ncbi:MAG: flagellar type III secretion system pore protein FliP [Phycisphaerales bacterium]|nr:flagellar type III secretion system pore protein FliP [Phycisphaerales bacterium]
MVRWVRILVLVFAGFVLTGPAAAQVVDTVPVDATNPLVVLDGVAQVLPGEKPELSTTINILILLTVLSLAPSVLIMCTCFTRMVVVLGLLRQALGTQGLPPSQVVIGLSLFLTAAVMAPTLERTYTEGVKPYADGEITDYNVAWDRAKQPIRDFMFAQIEASGNWSGVYMMLNYRGIDTSDPGSLTREDVDMVSLIPAYILSELKVAFLMGFRIYLPFLVIDMVIASLLISMGMLMLPPVLISLPFKLLLFVMVDGWQLVAGSLMTSVAQPELMSVASLMTSGVYFT